MSAILDTQEITETRNGKTSVHRVGPLAGLCAVLLSCAILAFIFSIVAFSTTSWAKVGLGLWNVSGPVGTSFNGVRAMVTLSFLASFGSLVMSILYTFVHSVSKGLVLRLLIAIAALAGFFMFAGAVWFVADVTRQLGSSFFLGVVAFILDIVVAVVAYMQKNKADA